MRTMMMGLIGLCAGVMVGQPAAAVPIDYNFGGGRGDRVASIEQTVAGVGVTVTAWSLDTRTSSPERASIGRYGPGLGVVNADENGSAPQHTIDNRSGYDFLMLTFTRPVQLLMGTLVPFSVNGPKDNDSWVSHATMAGASAPTDPALWAELLRNGAPVRDALRVSGNTMNLNPGLATGTQWIIGADKFVGSGLNDGFKLQSLSVQMPVPEPATWGMMIGGIGMVGGVMRRRRAAGQVRVLVA